jgi:hypothetical protein
VAGAAPGGGGLDHSRVGTAIAAATTTAAVATPAPMSTGRRDGLPVLWASLGAACLVPSTRGCAPGAGLRTRRLITSMAVGRRAGSLSRHCSATSRSRPSSPPRSGGSLSTRFITAWVTPVPNGARPQEAKTIVPAQENMSAAGPSPCPMICSGAMYAGVPICVLLVMVADPSVRAIPKSITRGPPVPMMTLPGLKSRCTTWASWMAASAVAVPMASRSRSAPASGPSSLTARSSERPSTYSLMMYGRPPSTPVPSTAAVQNGATRRATSASWRKRAAISSSPDGLSHLTATCVPMGVRAR